jgi:predicted NBD/HSP70 family sugar kinase
VGTRKLVKELCEACLDKSNMSLRRLIGVGIALPSPVDPRAPEHLSEIVLPDWQGRHGFEMLSDAFDVPLFVDNDANLGALAERWWGAGRGVEDFAYVKIATGIGSGHMSGGRLFRGANGVAGEIGHMAIDPHGAPCVCGLRGCLATLIGSQALIDRAAHLANEYPDSPLATQERTLAAVEHAALIGDPLATRLVHETAENLGIAIASMLNLMNPAKVILGGSISHVGELLLEPLRETVRRRTLVSSVDASAIVASELGPRAGAVGAATMVLEAALNDSRLFPTTHRRMESR